MRGTMRSIETIGLLLLLASIGLGGCARTPKYGVEKPLKLETRARQIWAVAPVVNLSGEAHVDPLLQADLVYRQLQQVQGLTVIPVNRVIEVYAGLGIRQVQSEEQAALVCDLLGCDGLLIPTVTAYNPYEPPMLGASLQLFAGRKAMRQPDVDPRELARRGAPNEMQPLPRQPGFIQVVGVFDAANGSVRDELVVYAAGRSDPVGPYGPRQYFVDMDRYCGFVYHKLIAELLSSPRLRG